MILSLGPTPSQCARFESLVLALMTYFKAPNSALTAVSMKLRRESLPTYPYVPILTGCELTRRYWLMSTIELLLSLQVDLLGSYPMCRWWRCRRWRRRFRYRRVSGMPPCQCRVLWRRCLRRFDPFSAAASFSSYRPHSPAFANLTVAVRSYATTRSLSSVVSRIVCAMIPRSSRSVPAEEFLDLFL